ncbi:AAA family ATPase [Massilia terrae]|uniref:AAA family ATPase n=1 Tax=Massilia terrae TaxID=1811224 RepID=A0ABT2CUF3_9BURK|nr:AAA family ATPase [Massilia terrae]MCS0656708.1 AAA family ATPase [Massilia terrae]
MRILRIAGRNLASLAGEFSVDFESEPLASSGLFAISGPTGAGKSTLLDALCLALYGTTPRLPKTGPRASSLPDVNGEPVSTVDPRNLLRRGTAEGYAEVDFAGSDGLRYRARWAVRRSRNKPGGPLQPASVTLHQLPEMAQVGRTNSEAAAEIAQRVGLSFEQFTRAVLLAQNEFSAFLKTDENERGELLETLTGSVVYSDMSRRAFERARREQDALRMLTDKLAMQAPLPAEARAELDAQKAQAELALAEVDARRALLEQQRRWHEELAKLRRNVKQAEEALASHRALLDAAGERRRRLATLEAVQPARPLLAESDRLARELAQAVHARAKLQQEFDALLAGRRHLEAALEQAGRALAEAQAAQRDAAPAIDKAKELDAAIAALLPARDQSATALDAATNASVQAEEALSARRTQLDEARNAHQDSGNWLAAHARHEQLAMHWDRWERLLSQAVQAAHDDAALDVSLRAADAASRGAAARSQQSAQATQAAQATLRDHESSLQQAADSLGAFDLAALRAERQQIDQRREQVTALEKLWARWSEAARRLEQANVQHAATSSARDEAAKALTAAARDHDSLAAAAAQAERMLAGAELACADSVEQLRAQLSDDAPCPVCGGADHPYRHTDPRLHALLDGLRAEVDRTRGALQANLSTQAAQRQAADSATQRLAALDAERSDLAAAVAELAQAWDRNAPAADNREAWLEEQSREIKEQAASLDIREQAAHAAAKARDAAQQACDAARAEHARLLQLAQTEADQAARLHADSTALQARREAAAGALAALLEELDEPLSQADGDGWQSNWREDPAAYRRACAAHASAWRVQSERLVSLAAHIATLDVQVSAATEHAAHAARAAATARAEFTRADLQVKDKQRERATLWEGMKVQQVEQALANAVEQARAALAARQQANAEAAQREAAVQASLQQTDARCTTLRSDTEQIDDKLAAWLDKYTHSGDDLDPIPDRAALAKLLSVSHEELAREREALQQLETQLAAAATVLAERSAQRDLHAASAPAGGYPDAEQVGAALETVERERAGQHEQAAALRLQAAQDDERRVQGQALLAGIEQQQAIERKWARLSELIGSSDGKKFRNYAQQFTLDVLLGYANRHLSQLARRYRLERVVHPTGPSLALMVRDQDMGGEVRPVNSLSGGESFLVSLALALGLASLSSNRVKVESLFIDEGFGSLDSDTLGVAMEALDALQAQGRKVGVISHVHEMTERIAAKIVVRPAGGGASAISVQ